MIFLAVERDGVVYAYNEQKNLCLKTKGRLKGYTCNNVAVESENTCIYIYDEHGTKISEYPKDFVDISNIAGVII